MRLLASGPLVVCGDARPLASDNASLAHVGNRGRRFSESTVSLLDFMPLRSCSLFAVLAVFAIGPPCCESWFYASVRPVGTLGACSRYLLGVERPRKLRHLLAKLFLRKSIEGLRSLLKLALISKS